eukprot:COSAG01_NODE_3462_length_6067_cov_3.183311_3_plen_229_part_00
MSFPRTPQMVHTPLRPLGCDGQGNGGVPGVKAEQTWTNVTVPWGRIHGEGGAYGRISTPGSGQASSALRCRLRNIIRMTAGVPGVTENYVGVELRCCRTCYRVTTASVSVSQHVGRSQSIHRSHDENDDAGVVELTGLLATDSQFCGGGCGRYDHVLNSGDGGRGQVTDSFTITRTSPHPWPLPPLPPPGPPTPGPYPPVREGRFHHLLPDICSAACRGRGSMDTRMM